MTYAHYGDMAALVEFPRPGLAGRGRSLLETLAERCPEAAHEVEGFLDAIPAATLDQQELHTRTFDVQALTTLDAGYVLFGDDYKRGALLSNLNQEHRRANNDCGGELADHLPNLLRLIPRLEDREVRDELVAQIVVPAVMLMIREFEPARVERKNASYRKHYKTLIDPAPAGDSTVYRRALKAVLHVLERDFQLSGTIAKLSAAGSRRQTVEFLQLVEREMEIEQDANPTNSGCDA